MICSVLARPVVSRVAVRFALTALVALAGLATSLDAAQPPERSAEERRAEYFARVEADREPPTGEAPMHLVPCVGGMAGSYPCDGVDLLEFVPLATMGATSANDIWGWTDTASGREFALVGLNNGTAFVEITNPVSTVYLGKLPTHTSNSTWRDIKVHAGHAFIVSEASGHGMQVFDLTQLLSVPSPPVTFSETAHYNGFGNAHNVVINEDSGYAYAVGTSTCSGGLHMVNIQNPASPTNAGCFSADGYTHDAQCVNYAGPDPDHQGDEICFNSNEDTVTIVDVTNHASPVQVSRTGYAGSAYTHQNWLTEDHQYLLVDDELDEQNFGHNTWTYVWDVTDLDNPQLLGHFTSPTPAIDHNQYVRGNYSFQANYRSGLRILRLDDLAQAQLTQVGYFDVYPANDNTGFNGAWSVYPYFPSNVVVVSGIEQGLFVLQPTTLCTPPAQPSGLAATPNGANRIDLTWAGSGNVGNTFQVERALGGCGGTFETIASGLIAPAYDDTSVSGTVTYGYRVREEDASGDCASEASACVEASTTGACTAPPAFDGISSAASAGTATCRIDLAWPAASPYCAGPARYNVYRSTTPDFVPSVNDRIAANVSGSAFQDLSAPPGQSVHYVVRALDLSNGAEESNLVHATAKATGPVADGTFATGAEPGDPIFDTLGDGPLPESPEHIGWEVTDTSAHTGTRSFWSTSSSNLCVTLEGDLTLTGGQSSQLGFWTRWGIEAGWDGGVIDVSTNGGTSWTRLTPAGGYPGSINNGGNACGLPVGTPVFNGTNLTYQPMTIGLGAYAGQTIRLRWQYSSDTSVNGPGWFVDDVTVTHTQVPSACVTSLILIADHEEGDTSDWSFTQP